jgi:hypothetical protein
MKTRQTALTAASLREFTQIEERHRRRLHWGFQCAEVPKGLGISPVG